MNSKIWCFSTCMEEDKDIVTFHWINTKSQVTAIGLFPFRPLNFHLQEWEYETDRQTSNSAQTIPVV